MFVTDTSRWEEIGRAHGEVFGAIRPVTVDDRGRGLLDPRMLVEIEADAFVGRGRSASRPSRAFAFRPVRRATFAAA